MAEIEKKGSPYRLRIILEGELGSKDGLRAMSAEIDNLYELVVSQREQLVLHRRRIEDLEFEIKRGDDG